MLWGTVGLAECVSLARDRQTGRHLPRVRKRSRRGQAVGSALGSAGALLIQPAYILLLQTELDEEELADLAEQSDAVILPGTKFFQYTLLQPGSAGDCLPEHLKVRGGWERQDTAGPRERVGMVERNSVPSLGPGQECLTP